MADEKRARVVVVGSCMTDLVSYAPWLPKPGETVHGTKFTIGFGGKGANQCVVAARLGAITAMVAKVGDDSFGHNYLQNFKDNGINMDHVFTTNEAATGVAPISVDESGQNSIIIVSGANLLLSANDVLKAEEKIKAANVVVCQFEVSMASTVEALRVARKHGVKTILNAAPGTPNPDPAVFELSDIFCINETEAELLTCLSVTSMEEACIATQDLLQKGCKSVILTVGEKGALYASQMEPQVIHIPARKVKALDTTGAGDAFLGALAYYLAYHSKLPMKEIIQRSCGIAAISVQKAGTQTSYPYRKDLSQDYFA